MVFGGYGKGKEESPRVFPISIARFSRELPARASRVPSGGDPRGGTGITWQQNITVEPDTERYFLDTTETLYRRGLGYGGGTPEAALAAVDELGPQAVGDLPRRRRRGLPGRQPADRAPARRGRDHAQPAVGADGLEWGSAGAGIPVRPHRAHPGHGRAPAATRSRRMRRRGSSRSPTPRPISPRPSARWRPSRRWPATTVSSRSRWTCWPVAMRPANFLARLTRGDYDIVHFAGHAGFDPTEPEASALRLADGFVTADELLALDWKAPPYLVFNSACESGTRPAARGWSPIRDRPTGWPPRFWRAARPRTPATSGR